MMGKKIKRVKYFTKEKKKLISDANKKLYDKYLRSNIVKNRDVKDTTYKVYKNNMEQFMVYLAEEWDNIGLYSEDFMENAVDIMEGYMLFCQEVLHNHKKTVNNKIAAVSSFYVWSMKRGLIDSHPFDNKLDRMKDADKEQIISNYFLTDEQIQEVRRGLLMNDEYDIQDRLIWEIMFDSCNRVGAIEKLTLSSLDLDNMMFTDIREKRGYRVEVAFGEVTKDLIEEWLEMRKDMDNLEVDSLFITYYDGRYRPMHVSTIKNRIKKIGYILGIDDFRSHCIRKTAINNIYEKTNNIELAAEMGNHQSIETTRAAYIKPKSKAEVRKKIRELMEARNKQNKS